MGCCNAAFWVFFVITVIGGINWLTYAFGSAGEKGRYDVISRSGGLIFQKSERGRSWWKRILYGLVGLSSIIAFFVAIGMCVKAPKC